jgi:hypothetical protein
MTGQVTSAKLEPAEPDIDANGVDRAQIREVLEIEPAERSLVIQGLADSLAEIRGLDGPSAGVGPG